MCVVHWYLLCGVKMLRDLKPDQTWMNFGQIVKIFQLWGDDALTLKNVVWRA